MKKKASTVAFISVLLFSLVAGTQLVNLGRANPYHFILMEEVPPDADTKPPTISMLSPENNKTAYAANNVVLSLNVSVKYSSTAKALFFWKIYYEADWQRAFTSIYEFIPETGMSTISEFNTTLELKRIPEGNHAITVYAIEGGRYEEPEPGGAFVTLYYPFEITGSSSVSFTIDVTPPKVSILSLEKIYSTSSVPLNFILSEKAPETTYSLDGQDNVTIAGNTTLANVPYGDHNITVYAIDNAGNTGASETIAFTVGKPPEPFPVAPVATASVATAVVVGGGLLLVYFKKRQRGKSP